MKNIFIKNNNDGQVMMIVIMALSGVMIGAVAISGALMSREIRQTADAGSFSRAVFAADAGLEWRLYKFNKDFNKGYVCENCPGPEATFQTCQEYPDFSFDNVKVDLKTSCTSKGNEYTIYSKATVKDSSYTLYYTIPVSK